MLTKSRRTSRVFLVFTLLLVAVSWSALTPASTSASSVTTPALQSCQQARGPSVALPLFNNAAINHLRTTLRPKICPGDTLALVSGNINRRVDPSWVNRAATVLSREFPRANIVALTSGLQNISIAANNLNQDVEYLGYIYEPNFPNTPEFTWDFSQTMQNFRQVSRLAHQNGFKSWGMPTGRPLLQSYLLKYGWDYGKLGAQLDGMSVQTQTYCKDGPERFAQAMRKLVQQFRRAGVTYQWYVQISIHRGGYNSVPLNQGISCAREALAQRVPGVFIWWASAFPQDLKIFLERMGR